MTNLNDHGESKKSVRWVLIIAIFILGVFVGRVTQSSASVDGATGSSVVIKNKDYVGTSNKAIDFKQFWQVWTQIQEKYVTRPADEQKMFQGAIAGMVASLEDPYSVYFTPQIADQFEEELGGTFSGIGAEVGMKNNRVVIVAPLPETPAEAAGLLPGDYIVEVDGNPTMGLSVDEVVKKIRGEQGTDVTLTIERDGKKGQSKFTIKRNKIELKSVTYKTVGDNVMLITLSGFNDQTEKQFDVAINAALAQKAKGIILDLRNNPGGYFETSILVASEWLQEKQLVVVEREGEKGARKEFFTNGKYRLHGIPTTVLINKGSASASEIVAGALQDHKAATIIGAQSFGKGSVQEYQELPDGSALKLTIALWFTPNDRSINESGITPDIVIADPKPEDEAGNAEALIAARKDPTKDPYIQRALQFLKTGK